MKNEWTVGGVTFDLKLTLIIILSVILPLVDRYYLLTSIKAYDRFILYLVIPMAIILLLFRERPSTYGFQWGDWRAGLKWTAVVCLIIAPILWWAAQNPTMQQYYLDRNPVSRSAASIIYLLAVDLVGWEFIWRGFLLFGLARVLGPGPAIFLQAVPFAFMHIGKPPLETFSTIFGGAGFGFVAWKSRSFVYPFLIHWFVSVFTIMVATGRW
jgi:uncharacterized protein